MKKSLKFISLLLSVLIAASCLSISLISAVAAQIDLADSGVDTAEQRIAAGHQLVFFRFPDEVWGPNSNVKFNEEKKTCNVFCNIYALYGNTKDFKTRAWEDPATAMLKDSQSDSVYYFDITESGQGEIEEGADYCVCFSTKANAGKPDLLQPNSDGFMSCDLYLNFSRVGSTYCLYEPAQTRENTENSQNIDYKGYADTPAQDSSMRKVSSLCAYIDGVKAPNSPNAIEIANALQRYLPNPVTEPYFNLNKIASVINWFNTTAQDVYDTYAAVFSDQLQNGAPYTPAGDGSDCNEDGSLKDIYRYVSVTTQEYNESTGVTEDVVTKYPTLDLVRERLGLKENISAVSVSLGNAVIAPGEALPRATAPDDAPYTVEVSWSPDDATFAYDTAYILTVTFTADENSQFTDETAVSLNDVGEGSVEHTSSSTLENGVLTAAFTFTMGKKPILLGDVDADDKVSVLDATAIQKKLASISVPVWIESASDVDGDGKVTVLDATYIQKWLASIEVPFAIGEPIA